MAPLYTETTGWHDPTTLTAALAPGARDIVLSLDPSGENACTLAILGAGRVVVALPRFPEFALLSLRLAAVRHLPIQSVRSLFGWGDFGRRLWFYHHLREFLSPEVRRFWDAHEDEIRRGLVDQGRRERLLQMFRTRILPLLVPAGAVDAWFRLDTLEEQRVIWARDWDGLRWRAFIAMAERRAGHRDAPELRPGAHDPRGWRLRVARMFTDVPARDNFILQQALLGRPLDLDHAAPAWSSDGHLRLRAALHRIELRSDPLPEVLRSSTFTRVDLHTALETHHDHAPADLLPAALRATRRGGRVLAWTGAPGPEGGRDPVLEADLHRHDRTFLSGGIALWTP